MTLTLRGTMSTVGLSPPLVQLPSPPQALNVLHDRSTAGNVRQREPRTVCTASDINQTQTPPLRYASSTRERRAFVHDIGKLLESDTWSDMEVTQKLKI